MTEYEVRQTYKFEAEAIGTALAHIASAVTGEQHSYRIKKMNAMVRKPFGGTYQMWPCSYNVGYLVPVDRDTSEEHHLGPMEMGHFIAQTDRCILGYSLGDITQCDLAPCNNKSGYTFGEFDREFDNFVGAIAKERQESTETLSAETLMDRAKCYAESIRSKGKTAEKTIGGAVPGFSSQS